jgi:enolase
MSTIIEVRKTNISDQRNPTVEVVDVFTSNGIKGKSCRSFRSFNGEHEAVELRDGGKAYMGKGVTKA